MAPSTADAPLDRLLENLDTCPEDYPLYRSRQALGNTKGSKSGSVRLYGPCRFRIRHYPIFIASLNLSTKKRRIKSEVDGKIRFESVSSVTYPPDNKLQLESLKDHRQEFKAVWFKSDELEEEKEGRMVWRAPDTCTLKHIKVRSPMARQLIEPF